MISIDFSKVASEPLKASTKIHTYQDQFITKVYVSSTQEETITNLDEVIKSSNHVHPHILSCLGHNFQTSGSLTKVYVVYPKLKYSLADLLQQHVQKKTKFSKQDLVNHFDSLLSAVAYLREQNISHRNIKPENILFDEAGAMRVTEIGSANIAKLRERNTLYVAPEISQMTPVSEDEWFSADVWSVGMVMLEMCDQLNTLTSVQESVKNFAYSDISLSQIRSRIEEVGQKYENGQKLAQVLSLMLDSEASSRPTFSQVKWLLIEGFSGSSADGSISFAPADGTQTDNVSQDSHSEGMSPLSFAPEPDSQGITNEEAKSDANPVLEQSKGHEKKFYDMFYVKFVDRFRVIHSGATAHICVSSPNLPGKSVNLQSVMSKIKIINIKSIAMTDNDLILISVGILLLQHAETLVLDFRGAKAATDKGFKSFFELALIHLKNLKSLSIWVDNPAITDLTLKSLASGPLNMLPNLRKLFLYFPKTQITDKALDEIREPVSRMKSLTDLQFWIFQTKITDASVRMLCSQVLYPKTDLLTLALALTTTSTTNVSLQELTYVVLPRLAKLQHFFLHIGNLPVTEDAISNLIKYGLAGLSQLQAFNLGISNVKALNDTLMEQLVEVGLANKPKLKQMTLYVSNTKVTNKTIVDFCYKLLPKLTALEKFEIQVKGSKIDNKVLDQIKHLPFYSKCKIVF